LHPKPRLFRGITEGKAMEMKTIVRSTLAVLAIAASGVALAGGSGFGRGQAPSHLEGSWLVKVQPVFCDTGATRPVPAFDSLITFGAGGTVIETTSMPAFAPGQRSIGVGYWERTGRNSYDAVYQAFVQSTAGQYTRGTQRVELAITLVDTDRWTTTADVIFRDMAGNVIPPTGCMSATAERMP
jgi:hypothetical protein